MKLYGWRDVDSERRRFGFKLWWRGGEVSFGKRMYRFRVGEIPGTYGPTTTFDDDVIGIDGDGEAMLRKDYDYSFWTKEDAEIFEGWKASLNEMFKKDDPEATGGA